MGQHVTHLVSCSPGGADSADSTGETALDQAWRAAHRTPPCSSVQAKFGEDGKPGFFAIASAPGADKENGAVELLIKSQGGTAEQLCGAAAGARRTEHSVGRHGGARSGHGLQGSAVCAARLSGQRSERAADPSRKLCALLMRLTWRCWPALPQAPRCWSVRPWAMVSTSTRCPRPTSPPCSSSPPGRVGACPLAVQSSGTGNPTGGAPMVAAAEQGCWSCAGCARPAHTPSLPLQCWAAASSH